MPNGPDKKSVIHRKPRDLEVFLPVGRDRIGSDRINIHPGIESALNIPWNELKYKTEGIKEFGIQNSGIGIERWSGFFSLTLPVLSSDHVWGSSWTSRRAS